jgi:predicted hydrocarbon binding protein
VTEIGGENMERNWYEWKSLGDIAKGRPNLGPNMNLAVYRLLQYSLRNVLIKKLGETTTREIFVDAGNLAGCEFCKNLLNKDLDLPEFLAKLQEKLRDLNVGVLRIEKTDEENMQMVLTMAEDLDCSGLPATGETVCDFDEGFIAGILTEYTGKEWVAKEIDCWATGSTVCRFSAFLKDSL